MPINKKIMYLIGTLGHGKGGHFYSLRTTAESLNDIIEPFIVNIGKYNSPVIDSSKVANKMVYFNGWNFIITLRLLVKIVRKEKPDVIHSFDSNSYFFARAISAIYKIPVVHTLCGGPNPSGYYPYVNNFILFSKENLDYFRGLEKFRNSIFNLIPNRVNQIKCDQVRIKILKEKIDSNKTVFLRIARFGKSYKKSMIQAINLNLLLNSRGFSTQLVIIGVIEDELVYKEVVEYIENKSIKHIHLVTDDVFTLNASELVDVADCVIGTGRSFMEASSRYKILFTTVNDSDYPVLVNDNNFFGFFNTNFSPRNILSEDMKKDNLEDIIQLFQNDDIYKDSIEFSKKIFYEYFDINSKEEVYKNIYQNVLYNKNPISDFLEHFFRTIKNFIK